MRRIAIVGASGFVGGTLMDELVRLGRDEVVPLIHSSGNAWRVARHGADLKQVSLLDEHGLHKVLDGCSHVVNCSRGSNETMLEGLKHLLAVCKTQRIKRFVHLSSVAVYGDPPPPESVHENAPTSPEKDSYGWIKLIQDKMVAEAAQGGLACVTICPPNIGGPYSMFLLGLVEAIRAGKFALVDDGAAVCNLVDVRNLVAAILLALDSDVSDGRRLFVTDGQDATWGGIVTPLASMIEANLPPEISRDDLAAVARRARTKPSKSLKRAVMHLVSSDVRQAMRKDPLLESVDTVLRRAVASLGRGVEDKLRYSIEGPLSVRRSDSISELNIGLAAQQLRGVRHSHQAATSTLGYQPAISFERSMLDFTEWYRELHGMNESNWDLARNLVA